ncbi:MAG: hypothetical protein GXP15_12305 [Gammaproteobacteria bacterium]|nr:hypothetical protein [Gammaproteobacteria bacterium]
MNNIDSKVRQSNTYSCIQQKFKADECVTLDGANATALQRQGAVGFHLSDAAHRGFDSLDLAPRSVQALHKSYLDADRVDRASVAFGIGGDIETEEQLGTVELLLKVFDGYSSRFGVVRNAVARR